MGLWAAGQGCWMLVTSSSFSGWPFALQYALFVSSSAPLIVACAVRPDRPRPGALGLAADRISTARSDPRAGDVVVHFPRAGYIVQPG